MLCCVCLLENTQTMGIYKEDGVKLKIGETIQKHLWFKPEKSDALRSHICFVCWETLLDFHVFYEQAKRIHEEFKAIKEEEEMPISPNGTKHENHELYENLLEINIEIGESMKSMSTDGNDATPVENPLENVKKDLDILKMNIDKSMNSMCTDSNDKTTCGNPLEDSQKDVDNKTINKDEQNDIHTFNTNILNDTKDIDIYSDNEYFDDFQPSDEEISYDDGSQSSEEESPTKVPKIDVKPRNCEPKIKTTKSPKNRKAVYKINDKHADEMILKYIPMACNLCVFIGKTFPDIVEHFKVSHPRTRPYVTCCDKQFTKRSLLAQHALKHEDPNCFKCNECNKSFATTCALRVHNLNYHAPEEERTFACDLCPKKFARQNLLELHKPSHIPREQWQFFCDECPKRKSFASLYLLKVHTSMQHKRAKQICHVCAKEILGKNAFEKHVRTHFEQSGPRVKCPYPDCDSWLKDKDILRQHLKRHNPEGMIYKCPECGKVVKNRIALASHKRYSHSNETFQCEQCDKTFKKAISLREHMAQHTGETLYQCPFCPRTFNSNANMHSHKKNAHPIEWEICRRNKLLIKQQNLNLSSL
ncbi:transcription factor grauzone-like [Musca autumnalis]|uniref:transcription factor grauzone-like n=1 Tax=Musca autumnalis TaxID=221902 RepID=UPI003CED03F8